jgi:hypothetical protein
LSPQLLEPITIVGQFRQNPIHLRHDVALIRKRHLAPHLRTNDIPRPAEVNDHRYGATGESFENYACTIVANGRKQQHISRSQAQEDFRMAEPAAEAYCPLDSKGCRKLLEAIPLRAIADHGKVGQIASQKGSSRAQGNIASLPGNQTTNENQLKSGAGLRTARVRGTHGKTDAGLRDKKQLVAIRSKLGTHLGRSA